MIESDGEIQEKFAVIGIHPQGCKGNASATDAIKLRRGGKNWGAAKRPDANSSENGQAHPEKQGEAAPPRTNGTKKEPMHALMQPTNKIPKASGSPNEWRHTDFAISMLLPHVKLGDLKKIWQSVHTTNGSNGSKDPNRPKLHVYDYFIDKGITFDVLLRKARRKGTRLNDFCIKHKINLANQRTDYSKIYTGEFQSLTGSSMVRPLPCPKVVLR